MVTFLLLWVPLAAVANMAGFSIHKSVVYKRLKSSVYDNFVNYIEQFYELY